MRAPDRRAYGCRRILISPTFSRVPIPAHVHSPTALEKQCAPGTRGTLGPQASKGRREQHERGRGGNNRYRLPLRAPRVSPSGVVGRRARVAPFPVGLFFRPVPYAGVATLGLTSVPIPRASSGDGGAGSPYGIRTRACPPCSSRLRPYRRSSSTPSRGGAWPFLRYSRPGHPRHHVAPSTRSRSRGALDHRGGDVGVPAPANRRPPPTPVPAADHHETAGARSRPPPPLLSETIGGLP